MKSKYLWAIDAGHGGLKNGIYATAPAKMFTFPDGFTIYEGDVNRKIAELLYTKLFNANIDFALVYDDFVDTSLSMRVELINKLWEKDKRTVSLSIHSNAGGGRGFEVFTSPGQTHADLIAEYFARTCIRLFPSFPFRADKSDGDMDKEAKFVMVASPRCPSVLVENLFMDNRAEAEFLVSKEGQEQIAEYLFQSIQQIEKDKPI